jgi:selenoprotein W-related protein
VELIRGSGGVFEISVNGDLVYSKKQTGVFPDEDDLLKKIQGMAL